MTPLFAKSHQWNQAIKSQPSIIVGYVRPARRQCNPHVPGRRHHVAGARPPRSPLITMWPQHDTMLAMLVWCYQSPIHTATCATGSCAHNMGSRQTPVTALKTAQGYSTPYRPLMLANRDPYNLAAPQNEESSQAQPLLICLHPSRRRGAASGRQQCQQ